MQKKFTLLLLITTLIFSSVEAQYGYVSFGRNRIFPRSYICVGLPMANATFTYFALKFDPFGRHIASARIRESLGAPIKSANVDCGMAYRLVLFSERS